MPILLLCVAVFVVVNTAAMLYNTACGCRCLSVWVKNFHFVWETFAIPRPTLITNFEIYCELFSSCVVVLFCFFNYNFWILFTWLHCVTLRGQYIVVSVERLVLWIVFNCLHLFVKNWVFYCQLFWFYSDDHQELHRTIISWSSVLCSFSLLLMLSAHVEQK